MPDRLIRDEILTSERYCSVTRDAKLLFFHLMLSADNYGNFSGKNFTIRVRCFPGEQIHPDHVDKWLGELHDQDLIRFYEVAESRYLHIPRFRQRLRETMPKYPLSPWNSDEEKQWVSQKNVRQRTDSSQSDDRSRAAEGKGREVKKNIKPKFAPPSVDEVRAYAQENGYQVNPEKFVAHYESIGWMRGKNPMKSWKSTVVTWHQTALERKGSDTSSSTPVYITGTPD